MNLVHIADALLVQFARGEIDTGPASDDLVETIALHLDACPACAARVEALDPMRSAFAAVDDPVVPDGLTDAILESAQLPRASGPEPAIAATLLTAAAAMLLLAGVPGDLMATGATTMRVVSVLANAAVETLQISATTWTMAAAIALVFAVFTARRLEMGRRQVS